MDVPGGAPPRHHRVVQNRAAPAQRRGGRAVPRAEPGADGLRPRVRAQAHARHLGRGRLLRRAARARGGHLREDEPPRGGPRLRLLRAPGQALPGARARGGHDARRLLAAPLRQAPEARRRRHLLRRRAHRRRPRRRARRQGRAGQPDADCPQEPEPRERARLRRGGGAAHRLRRGQDPGAHARHGVRAHQGYAGLHGARAGARRARHHQGRRLRARPPALVAVRGPATAHRRDLAAPHLGRAHRSAQGGRRDHRRRARSLPRHAQDHRARDGAVAVQGRAPRQGKGRAARSGGHPAGRDRRQGAGSASAALLAPPYRGREPVQGRAVRRAGGARGQARSLQAGRVGAHRDRGRGGRPSGLGGDRGAPPAPRPSSGFRPRRPSLRPRFPSASAPSPSASAPRPTSRPCRRPSRPRPRRTPPARWPSRSSRRRPLGPPWRRRPASRP